MECNRPLCARESDLLKTSLASSEKRVSQWEVLMRKFSEAHKEECKTVTLDIPRVKRAEKTFPTGSSYTGTWDVLGMSGQGTYKLPNGVIYEGEFDDGTFHGRGELRYPCGAVIYGKWVRGEMVERTLVFPDGLEYAEADWPYCMMPDRRFTIEIDDGLEPAGRSYLTAEQPTREIPPGFYDTGDGFYDPDSKIVFSAEDLTRMIRKPCAREQKWIMDNCRTNPMRPLGPRPDLYEEWSSPKTEPDVEVKRVGPNQPSFACSRSRSHLVIEDTVSGIGVSSKDQKKDGQSVSTSMNSRRALTFRLLSHYDDFPVEYIEQEIKKDK
ncbi:MORN repeat-containing protein 5-like isoform X1 [Cydia pomonella]|uniref:MORN repeat-containing protein 5-like isoform X1 n=2 Tax=Cydia pomonella TaxID=82600 RepID=UPI002ADD94FE|nr:MORN repeat-containing protein 5-like isoform X1 [Cydia pomonella]XP_061714082.1 MORN repeat-containing protein 5-like isoform X1 [Cydia pomonella]